LVGVGRLGVMDRFRGRYFLKFRISIDADSRASSKADGCLLWVPSAPARHASSASPASLRTSPSRSTHSARAGLCLPMRRVLWPTQRARLADPLVSDEELRQRVFFGSCAYGIKLIERVLTRSTAALP